MGVKCVLSH